MEREMCSYLEWELTVDASTLRRFESMVKKDLKGPGLYIHFHHRQRNSTNSNLQPTYTAGHHRLIHADLYLDFMLSSLQEDTSLHRYASPSDFRHIGASPMI
jgi:hypothetical protein